MDATQHPVKETRVRQRRTSRRERLITQETLHPGATEMEWEHLPLISHWLCVPENSGGEVFVSFGSLEVEGYAWVTRLSCALALLKGLAWTLPPGCKPGGSLLLACPRVLPA